MSTAAVAVAAAAGLLLFTWWAVLVVMSMIALTLIGGALVARDSSVAASGGRRGAVTILARGSGRFLLVWAVTTSIMWIFCAPDVYFRDGGELAGAAAVLGVPHPTGFPLLCMLGKLASLIPAGNSYFRLNLLSGLTAGGAAAFAYRYVAGVLKNGDSRPEPLWWVAPATLAGSATAWLHATTPEIYSLSMLGLSATLCLAVEGARRHDARLLMAAAALCGIGMGGHITWPLYGGPALLFCLVWFAASSDAASGSRAATFFRPGLFALVALIAGAAVVLYLPVAAGRDPLINWGNPSDLAGLVAHLTGQRIRDSFAPQMADFNASMFQANLSMAWRTFFDSTGPMLAFAVVGAVVATAAFVPAGLVLIAVIVGDFVFSARINPMGIRDLQVLLPATWATAVLAGIGVSAIAGRLNDRAGVAGSSAVTGLVGILLVFQWVASPADRDMSNVHGPKEITDRVLDLAGPGATVLASSDDISSSLLGRTAIEDARPDMIFLVKQHLADTVFVQRRINPYKMRLSEVDPVRQGVLDLITATPFESGDESPSEAVLRAATIFSKLGEVWVEPGEGIADSGVRPALHAGFPLWQFAPATASSPVTVRDAWMDGLHADSGLDRWGRAYLADWIRILGTWEAMKQDLNGARVILQSAVRMNPGDYRANHNLGVVLSDSGSPETALSFLIAAVSENPAYVRGWETLAKTADKVGRTELAADARRKAELLRGTDNLKP